MRLFSSFSRRGGDDPMRESAAMTTVYLLEWNQKFEQFLRAKIEELEARVAAQQTRISTQMEAEEREIWSEGLLDFDAIENEPAAAGEPEPPPDPSPTPISETLPATADSQAMETDYLALLGGNPDTLAVEADEWDSIETAEEDEWGALD